MRLFHLSFALLLACRPRPVEERRAEVEDLCAEFCPQRVECVPDGYAQGDVEECERKCLGDERPLEDSACGEASLAALECLAATSCEALPAAIAGAAADAECHAELREQQDRCDFTPLY